MVYYSETEGERQVIFDKRQLDFDVNWGTNKGFEGIAVDCKNMVAYIAKERDPRFIISYDLNKKEITDINLKDSEGDISDLKYQDGYLYILERNANLIAKMDAVSKKIISKVSYKNTL